MIEKKYLQLLICPFCGNQLKLSNERLCCERCKNKFDVKNNIPILIAKELSVESNISQRKWDILYKGNIVERNYKSDLTVRKNDAFITKYSNFYKTGVYVDLGCGIAWNTAMLAEKGVYVLGIDVSYQGIYRSEQLFKKKKLSGNFIQADFLHLPIKSSTIQFIYAGMSLEYAKDTVSVMKEAYRILKPGSRMIATCPIISLTTLTYQQLRGDIPNVFLLKNIMRWFHIHLLKGKYMKYGYGQTFSESHIKNSFKKAGFKVLEVGYFDTHYPMKFAPGIFRPLLLTLLRLRLFWPVAYFEVIKGK